MQPTRLSKSLARLSVSRDSLPMDAKGMQIRLDSGRMVALEDWRPANNRDQLAPPSALATAYIESSFCAAVIGKLVAGDGVPWGVWTRKRVSDEWERSPQHDLETQIEYPGGPQTRRNTRKRLMGKTILQHAIYGCAYWRILQSGGKGRRFLLMDPTALQIETKSGKNEALNSLLFLNAAIVASNSVDDEVIAYHYFNERLSPEEVISFERPSPFGPVGLSPLAHLWLAAAADNAAAKFNLKSLVEEGAMRGAFSDPSISTQEDVNKLTGQIARQYAEGRRYMVLGGTLSYSKMSDNAKEMEWLAGRKLLVAEFCAHYGVPIELILPENQPYANKEAAQRGLWQEGILPILDEIEESLNTALVPAKDRETVWIHYDTSNVKALQTSMAERVKMHAMAVAAGIAANASIAMFELPCGDQEGGDVPRYASNLIPIDDPLPDQGAKLPVSGAA
jgi:phage portal protein BeeE